jgi:hypothetical protein
MNSVFCVAARALCVAVLGVFTASAATAAPVIIEDHFLGRDWGNPANSVRDVIGPATFDFDHFAVDLAMGTVSVYGRFFGILGTPEAMQTVLGDLFLSTTGYDPVDPTSEDMFGNGTRWNYVARLDDGRAGGLGTHRFGLYSILPRDIMLSDIASNPSGIDIRHQQEVGIGSVSGSGRYFFGTYDLFSDHVTFQFQQVDLAAIGFGAGSGLRFEQSGAQDVIEGAIPAVPEPTSVTLLAAGLLFIGGALRRRLMAV